MILRLMRSKAVKRNTVALNAHGKRLSCVNMLAVKSKRVSTVRKSLNANAAQRNIAQDIAQQLTIMRMVCIDLNGQELRIGIKC